MKITFLGAGSTIFTRNVIGDCMITQSLQDSVFALYDVNAKRLEQSRVILEMLRSAMGGKGRIECYLGSQQRREALSGADFVINTIQVGGYDPCTITDFEIPKKFGLRQTIGDTLGIGGIMRALRTIPVLQEIAADMEAVCPDALFMNYTNPMAMLTGYLQRHTQIRTVGLCHSVQVCSQRLLEILGMEDKIEGRKERIAGINHMAWLLELRDKDGNDLYPQIRAKAESCIADPNFQDKVRLDYVRNFGYYCTESSVHNAEYSPFYIKSRYPHLIEKYGISLDEYPRRCVQQIKDWQEQYESVLAEGLKPHTRSIEYASRIMEAMVTNVPYSFGGNVLNSGYLIANLPQEACVEVPCTVDSTGIHPECVGSLPVQCAAMNMTNINVQLLTIEAAITRKREHIYQAAMLDPHTAGELDIDTIRKMVDTLIEAHGPYMQMYC